jgi:hypothetical protein
MYEPVEGVPNYTCINTLTGHGKAVGGISSLAYIPAGVFGDDHPDLKDGVLVCTLSSPLISHPQFRFLVHMTRKFSFGDKMHGLELIHLLLLSYVLTQKKLSLLL